MDEHPVFERFTPTESTSTGAHVFDFLGGRTRVAYNRNWATHAAPEGKALPPRMPSRNEHYFDWIAVLTAIDRAAGTFRMAELGAGWAPWLVRAATAARQKAAITDLQLMAVEADPTHHDWIWEHFRDNGVDPESHTILHGAACARPGMVSFPKIEDPDVTYGASLRFTNNKPTIEVRGYSMDECLAFFDGPLDLMHVDIQGAEYDLLPGAMDRLVSNVKSIMIGTHISSEHHENLAKTFRDAGWRTVFDFPRGETSETGYGSVAFGDGFLLFDNPALVPG